jgi:hypothetical protein
MSLLDTRNLFLTGRSAADDADSTMLLNHKDAIEFIVDAVPSYGITVPVVRNLHSLLMQGLLANPRALGAIRTTIVSIEGSVYIPTHVRLAVELFAWTYRRSIPIYQAVLTSMGMPDPLRANYREHLSKGRNH